MNKKIKILMCSYPQSNRGPGNAFINHLSALHNSESFDVELITQEHINNPNLFSKYDVFWFSIRFHPNLYFFLKNNFPNKKIFMGPNVLFEKAEIGPSDEWEKWFVENVECDLYFNKANFYLDRVKEFYKGSKKYKVLPNCIEQKSLKFLRDRKKNKISNKVLVYSKKRRIDKQFDSIFPEFLESLSKENIDFDVLTYGQYERADFMNAIPNYMCCFWWSIEDFCSNAQLEMQSIGTPVIGTPYNTTHTYDKNLVVEGSILTSEEWITWKDDVGKAYLECFLENKKMFNNLLEIENRIKYIESNHSYDAYSRVLLDYINE